MSIIGSLNDSVSDDKLSTPHRTFSALITNHFDPKSYQESITCPKRCAAMKAEIEPIELMIFRFWPIYHLIKKPSGVNGYTRQNSILMAMLNDLRHVSMAKGYTQ